MSQRSAAPKGGEPQVRAAGGVLWKDDDGTRTVLLLSLIHI